MSPCSHSFENMALAMSLLSLPFCLAHSVYAGAENQELSLTAQKSLWDQQYLFGDWGGTRSSLAKRGVTFDLFNINYFQADVSGSQTHHAANFGRFYGYTDIDFNK